MNAYGLAVVCEHVTRSHAPKGNASRRLGPGPSPRDALCFLSELARIIHERCCEAPSAGRLTARPHDALFKYALALAALHARLATRLRDFATNRHE